MHVALQCLGICMCVSQWDACSTTVARYLSACFTMRSCMQHYTIWVSVWLFHDEMHVALHYLGICMPVSQWEHACSTTSVCVFHCMVSRYLSACFTMRACMLHYSIWVSLCLFPNEIVHVALHYLGICMPVSQRDHACSTTLSGYLYDCFTMRSCM